ncbi:MAG: DNA-directed RNA polymerase subunit H [Nanoarchaeota archaeon]
MAKPSVTHQLIPEHAKLSEKDKKELFESYNITFHQLPKIYKADPAISHLEVKPGDVVRIKRPSITAKMTVFYRGVV